MKVPGVHHWIRWAHRRRIRKLIRSYRKLKANNQLGRIRRIKRELADSWLLPEKAYVSEDFFGRGAAHVALIVQQYVLTRIGGAVFNRALLAALDSQDDLVIHPLPKQFQAVLINHGMRVASMRCSVLWVGYIVLLWGYGLVSILRHFSDGVRSTIQSRIGNTEPYAFFIGLAKNNLPQPCQDGRSHDILSWYSIWPGAPDSIATLKHDVQEAKPQIASGKRVESTDCSIPPPIGLAGIVRYLGWSLRAIAQSAAEGLRGRWWYAVLLAESAKAALVGQAQIEKLAREYLFHFSDTIYRPAWTYEAEQKGAQITCYFYSTSEEFKLPSGYEPNSTYWKLMNWPRYLVWDDYHADLLRLTVGKDVDACVVGPIWFSSSPVELPRLPSKAVAVFDIQPIRSSGHFGLSTMADLDYVNPNVPMQFIQDIYEAVTTHGGVVAHKRKRHDSRSRKAYRRMVDRLSKDNRFIVIEPDTSAVRVTEQCRAVISMPFTSTGVLASYLGKPSAYYDPTGRLQKDDKGAHGIPILSGKDELREWVSAVMGTVGDKSLVQSV